MPEGLVQVDRELDWENGDAIASGWWTGDGMTIECKVAGTRRQMHHEIQSAQLRFTQINCKSCWRADSEGETLSCRALPVLSILLRPCLHVRRMSLLSRCSCSPRLVLPVPSPSSLHGPARSHDPNESPAAKEDQRGRSQSTGEEARTERERETQEPSNHQTVRLADLRGHLWRAITWTSSHDCA